MAHSFVENHVFNNADNMTSAVGEYNKQNYTDMIVDTNNSSSMVNICKHGKKRKYEGSGKRPNQRYNYLGCSARINISKRKDLTLIVKKCNLEHNHGVSKTIQDMQTPGINNNDEELILTLNDANVPPSQIRRVLKEKRSKVVSVSKIKNLSMKLSPSQCADKVMFKKFLLLEKKLLCLWKITPFFAVLCAVCEGLKSWRTH